MFSSNVHATITLSCRPLHAFIGYSQLLSSSLHQNSHYHPILFTFNSHHNSLLNTYFPMDCGQYFPTCQNHVTAFYLRLRILIIPPLCFIFNAFPFLYVGLSLGSSILISPHSSIIIPFHEISLFIYFFC
jgi:hypothetical protein